MKTAVKKSASPDTLFARFLQRKAKLPTVTQIHTWENDGGNVETSDQDFEIINGVVCCTWSQKFRAHTAKYLRFLRFKLQHFFHTKHLQHQSS